MTDTIKPLQIVPVTLEQANDYVRRLHRHNGCLPGALFSVGVADADGVLRFDLGRELQRAWGRPTC